MAYRSRRHSAHHAPYGSHPYQQHQPIEDPIEAREVYRKIGSRLKGSKTLDKLDVALNEYARLSGKKGYDDIFLQDVENVRHMVAALIAPEAAEPLYEELTDVVNRSSKAIESGKMLRGWRSRSAKKAKINVNKEYGIPLGLILIGTIGMFAMSAPNYTGAFAGVAPSQVNITASFIFALIALVGTVLLFLRR